MAADTRMGAVTLHVGDMTAMRTYYTRALGLDVIAENSTGSRVTLGRGAAPIVVLVHAPDLPRPRRGEAGLFHTAILFDDAASLAGALARLAQHAPHTFTGSADHLVSEAFYATDPEGNGVELYVDRPRSAWRWTGSHVVMDTLPLDPNAYLQAHATPSALEDTPGEDDAVVGHVHLQVGDVPTARAFYVDVLGFDETAALGHSALFFSAGGYHHHMAANTWASMGAGPRAQSLRLAQIEIDVPSADDVAALADRLRVAGIAHELDGGGGPGATALLRVADPWRNELHLTSAR
ncbi:Glyoxalase/bleomycin resistance protein/dioxygenase [Beutenbergia cavernae DSM 12333]|uniref:Glyoxalase/bleomycin resistance protein/dioxygenase n=2 Tax=Beutenbergia TaxID=84756 RepID=C5BX62_BEUC1|nr:Glyoxalase/bleomycin resistance protein/dioxygenase [Beutenbergia cavernae DSM 12333]